MRCRVCARYTGHAQVTLNGVTLTTSPLGNFDSTLVCHDYSYLPSGLLPISVQYASDPTDINNAFQFWIIPVKSVTEVADPVSLRPLQVAVHGYVQLKELHAGCCYLDSNACGSHNSLCAMCAMAQTHAQQAMSCRNISLV